MVANDPSARARAEAIELAVGDGLGVGPGVPVGTGVAVGVGVGSGVAVGSGIGVGLGDVGSGTGGEPLFCGSGTLWRVKSAALSSVSIVEPDGPPGSRSRLAPAAGAGAARPPRQTLAAGRRAAAPQ